MDLGFTDVNYCIPRKLLAQKIEWLNDVKWGVRNGNIIRRSFLCNSRCRCTHTVTGDSSLHHTPHLCWSVYPSLNSLLTRASSECTGAQWQLKRTVVSMYSRDKAVAVNTLTGDSSLLAADLPSSHTILICLPLHVLLI